jgi:hypothetical protein
MIEQRERNPERPQPRTRDDFVRQTLEKSTIYKKGRTIPLKEVVGDIYPIYVSTVVALVRIQDQKQSEQEGNEEQRVKEQAREAGLPQTLLQSASRRAHHLYPDWLKEKHKQQKSETSRFGTGGGDPNIYLKDGSHRLGGDLN